MSEQLKDFITRHPRFTYLGMGLLVGVLLSGITMYQADKSISRIERTLDKELEFHQSYVDKTTEKISTLREENRKLKSKTSTYKLRKPDGTVVERTASEVESEESASESVLKETSREYEEKLARREREIRTEVLESKDLTISGGVTSDLDFYGSITYTVYPPFSIQGFGTNGGTFGIGIGVRL